MIFIYVFYMDLFVEQNFLMNLIVLSLVHIFSNFNGTKHYLRRIAAAMIGSVASACCLIAFSYAAFVVLTALVIVPFMIRIAFQKQSARELMRRTALSWLSMLIVNGAVSAVEQWSGLKSLTIYVGLLVLLVSGGLVRVWGNSMQRQNVRMQVEVSHQGHKASCVGLYDSGNRLQMPDTGEAVHIVSPMLLAQLAITDMPERTIPFCALGTQEGSIPVMQMEQMCVSSGRKSICCKDVWVGCAEKGLLRNADYQIILHASVRLL